MAEMAPPHNPSLITGYSLSHHTILTDTFLAHLFVFHPCPRMQAALFSTMSPTPSIIEYGRSSLNVVNRCLEIMTLSEMMYNENDFTVG